MSLRCKKCRQELATQSIVTEGDCTIKRDNSVWYLEEDFLPEWIKAVVDETGWQKGRLNCPKCGGRVGGFDFISGHKCGCGEHVVPSVHVVRSKVDSV
ncbi:E3 ubiquitin-protein ligase [Blattella germanica]|nr:E3 ubiquitin-protein ligase [Blattella germanica]